MRILIVFMGGTIGCTVHDGVADTDKTTEQMIISRCGISDDDTLDIAAPFSFLSENSTCDTLSEILTYMLSVEYEKYDGIIITHGSDTLVYTSNLLAHALRFVKIPVVITAANYVMTDPRSNAADNLRAAYLFIKNVFIEDISAYGVYVSWKNICSHPTIYSGDRIIEGNGFPDIFSSWREPFAILTGSDAIVEAYSSTEYLKYSKPNNTLEFLRGKRVYIKNNVLFLRSYAGHDYSVYNIKGKEAVLLTLYHSGTTCMTGETTSFKKLAEKCLDAGASLYITPARNESYIYSSALGFKECSLNRIGEMSDISAYTALLLAYTFEGSDRDTLLKTLIR